MINTVPSGLLPLWPTPKHAPQTLFLLSNLRIIMYLSLQMNTSCVTTICITSAPTRLALPSNHLHYTCPDIPKLQPFEYEFDYSPAWRRVGQYMHWVKFLEDIADTYIRSALEVEPGTPTPPVRLYFFYRHQ